MKLKGTSTESRPKGVCVSALAACTCDPTLRGRKRDLSFGALHLGDHNIIGRRARIRRTNMFFTSCVND